MAGTSQICVFFQSSRRTDDLLPLSAFSFYDYVITFEREVEAVWQREFSTASVLIIAVRWVIFLQAIASQIPPSEKVRVRLDPLYRRSGLTFRLGLQQSCYAIIILVQAFELLGYLLTACTHC